MEQQRTYLAIDLKSFYASQECVERGLDPMDANLVVADPERTEKTICLAVSPALKSFGIPGRPRLFEVVQKAAQVNTLRRDRAPGHEFRGSSYLKSELERDPSLELSYLIAPPRMAHYMECSRKIYGIYLEFAAPEDIHVYSIDEVFVDVTGYLHTSGLSAYAFAKAMMGRVLAETGITATAGIGPNLYLCKVAMDIVAKHLPGDENGMRIAELTEQSYRETLWTHRPLTDFWRVGRGYARKLQQHGIYTMGDVARCALLQEDLLYDLFGVQAELLIDHAWGVEPCRISDIKAYKPQSNSLGAGQVLHRPYDWETAKLVLREMTDQLVLELVEKGLVTDQMVVTVGYDRENLEDPQRRQQVQGEITTDPYGRPVPKPAHGSVRLGAHTASTRQIIRAVTELYERITDPALLVRRLNLTANHVRPEAERMVEPDMEQLDLFGELEEKQARDRELEREKRRQEAVIAIRKKFGKNAILKGMNLREGATARDRNHQIGGHQA